ncbi:MAG: DNA polymerase IV, partial [Methylococcus sp.]
EFTDRVEPLSLDEAYLDVTRSSALQGSATLIAHAIQAKILATTQLTASAGVSYNKFLAKIASERHKPQGFFRILPGEAPPLLRELPIGAFHGVGRATEARMRTLGVTCGRDLERLPLEVLRAQFGKACEHYFRIVRGIDERPVNPQRVRKSCGAETTFQTDLDDPREMLSHLDELVRRVMRQMAAQGLRACHVTLKVKYADFEQVTRGRTVDHPFRGPGEVEPHLRDLLQRTEAGRRKVRLLGVSFSLLEDAHQADGQLDLYP